MSTLEVTETKPLESSEFKKYLEANPQFSEELMSIMVTMYNNPMKESQIQDQLKQIMSIEKVDPEMATQLRAENEQLRNEIYDMNDELVALEKEYEEIKEDEEL
jgi:predicted RNase H-like nuclease (RuvC/YqgF family)